jgi:polyisoprenoid-binding protein YceI
MWTMRTTTAGLLLLLACSTDASSSCFIGGSDSGTLEFSGAVEDTEFIGSFGQFSVEYCLDDDERPETGRISVVVVLASADSDNADRDETLMGPEFFGVDTHPEANWRSTAIEVDGDAYRADGELTLKAITRPQAIRFTLSPDDEQLVARGRFTMSGSADVDRQRFEVGTGEFADPEFVRNRVDVEFEVRLEEAG